MLGKASYSETIIKDGVSYFCASVFGTVSFYRKNVNGTVHGWEAKAEFPDVKSFVQNMLKASIKAHEGGSEKPAPLPTNIPGKPNLHWTQASHIPQTYFSKGDPNILARDAFMETLDGPLIEIFSHPYRLTLNIYNRFQERSVQKRDLVDLYHKHPWFNSLCEPQTLLDFVNREGVTGQWKTRNPDDVIIDYLENDYGRSYGDPNPQKWPISKATIRALSGSVEKFSKKEIVFLSSLPPSWLPKIVASDRFAEIKTFGELVDSELASKPADIVDLLGGTKGNLEELAVSINSPGGAVRNILDFVAAFQVNVIEPLYAVVGIARKDFYGEKSRLRVMQKLMGCKSLTKINELAVDWHQREAEIRHLKDYGEELVWEPLSAEVRTKSGDLQLKFLTSGPELHDEGIVGFDRNGMQGLNHCVASKAPMCARGETHIGVVRRFEKGGKQTRVSTFEVTVDIHERTRLIQHRGEGNRKPDSKATQLVEQWFAQVERKSIKLNPAAIMPRTLPSKKSLDSYDEAKNAMTAWSDFLKRNYRWMDPVDAAFDVLSVIEEVKAEIDADPTPEIISPYKRVVGF